MKNNNATESKLPTSACIASDISILDEAFVSDLYEQDGEFGSVGFKDSTLLQAHQTA
ncbi:hypothetical protein [Vibrio owensii]|uniref:hypothetical protein n=1 Tax=Vibrio harveyi group TaxID=717610 RepID=UPI003CC51280